MARLWSYGAELQSNAAGMEADTFTGTTSISTTRKRSGAASLRCNPTAGTGFVTHAYRAGSTVRTFFRTYVWFDILPSADCALLANTDGSVNFPSIWFKKTGNVFQAKDGGPTFVGSTSAAITTGVWYRLELDFNDASGDLMNAYIDGTQICTNVNAGDLGGSGQIRFGIITPSVTADAYFDDVAVNDSSGTAQNGLPGPGSIVHLLPNAAGDNNLWPTQTGGTAGSANNFTRVNQVTPDDATTFNAIAVTGTTQIDDFNVTDPATAGIGSSDTITLVAVGFRGVSAATTAASIVTRLKGQASGTTTESASLPVNVTTYFTNATAAPKVPKITAYTNPQTSTAWTPATLTTMQIGYRANVAQTTTRRVTALWAQVEYVPVSTTPVSQTLDARWAVNAQVSQAIDLRWTSYAQVLRSLDLRWGVASPVSAALDARWAVRASVSQALDVRWTVYNAVVASMDARWAVANTVSSTLDARWGVRATVAAAADLCWAVLALAASSTDLRWIVRNSVSSSIDLRWALASPISTALDARWRVLNVVASSVDARWAVLNSVSTGMDLRWVVRSSVASSTDLRWRVANQVASSLDLSWVSAGAALASVSATLDARWIVLNAVQAALDARWALRAVVSGSVDLRWAALAVVSSQLDARWAVAGRPMGVLDLRWAVRSSVASGLDLRWGLRSVISRSLDLCWTVLHGVATPIELLWVSLGAPDLGEPVVADVTARLTDRFGVVPTHMVTGAPSVRLTVVDPRLIRYRNSDRISAELTEEP